MTELAPRPSKAIMMPAACLTAVGLVLAMAATAQARLTRIVVESKVSPAFDGASFGNAGQYETLAGKRVRRTRPQRSPQCRHPGHQAGAAQCPRHGGIHRDLPAGEAGRHVEVEPPDVA